MKVTEKFGLKKPDPTDYYNVEDFNDNMDIIEKALSSGADVISESTTVYVSTSGSDDNDGTQDNPLKTVQEAINRCPNITGIPSAENTEMHYIVSISNGTYNESLAIIGKKVSLVTSGVVVLKSLTVSSAGQCTLKGEFHFSNTGANCITLYNSKLFCFGTIKVLAGSIGLILAEGSVAVCRDGSVDISNTTWSAVQLGDAGIAYIEDLMGSGNTGAGIRCAKAVMWVASNALTTSGTAVVSTDGGIVNTGTLSTSDKTLNGAINEIYELAGNAVPTVLATSSAYDMDTIIATEHSLTVYCTNSNTLGTPYKHGVTDKTIAYIFSESSKTYGFQLALLYGSQTMLMRKINNGVITDWDTGYLPLTGGILDGYIKFNNLSNFFALQKGRTISDDTTHWLTIGVGSDGAVAFEHYTGEDTDYNNATQDCRLEMRSMTDHLPDALDLRDTATSVLYKIYGQHNQSNLFADMVANNLTTTASGKFLDARQGKALYDMLAGNSSVNTASVVLSNTGVYVYSHGSGAETTEWTPLNGDYTLYLTKMGKLVNIRGTISAKTALADCEFTSIFANTIPSGFRPPVNTYIEFNYGAQTINSKTVMGSNFGKSSFSMMIATDGTISSKMGQNSNIGNNATMSGLTCNATYVCA